PAPARTSSPVAHPRQSSAPAAPAAPLPAFAAQPATRLGETSGIAVVALGAPQFSALPRDQRLVAWYALQAGAVGDAVAADQGYRRNLPVIRLLRGLLSRAQVVTAPRLARIRHIAQVHLLGSVSH